MKEFNEESTVEFAGIHNIEGFDKGTALLTANRTLDKIKKITKEQSRLLIHVKMNETQGKEGKRQKYTIHSKLFTPGSFLEATHVEWDFLSALQKSLSVLEKEVIKKFKQ